jgi:hypothetical protein
MRGFRAIGRSELIARPGSLGARARSYAEAGLIQRHPAGKYGDRRLLNEYRDEFPLPSRDGVGRHQAGDVGGGSEGGRQEDAGEGRGRGRERWG